MPSVAELRTERLLVRQWRESDIEPFARLNADPEVTRYLGGVRTRERSVAWVQAARTEIEERGWGLWAVEVPGTVGCIGFVGLTPLPPEVPQAPGIEVGWRLAREHWGHGYATEAARAALDFGFEELGLDEIVSMTAAANLRSRRVMERLEMTYNPADDFEHPLVTDPALQPHVLYRLSRPQPVA